MTSGQATEPSTSSALGISRQFMLSTGESLHDASFQHPIALVFLRHFGCTFTRQILMGLEELRRQADQHGARLVLVHMLRQGDELRYLAGNSGVARIADPDCRLYRAFGLGRGGFFELFGPRVIWLGMVSVFKGCGVGHLAGDGLQMPGAFVFHRGAVTVARKARTAADLPDLSDLLVGHSADLPSPNNPSKCAP
ncbi:MAG TPA: AhpC/TSA family protein [Luteolibacter sp.]|nr:AhpC/TSA family protein [Luteolibacter sp.]